VISIFTVRGVFVRKRLCGVGPPSHSAGNFFLHLFLAGYISHWSLQAHRGVIQGFGIICDVFECQNPVPLASFPRLGYCGRGMASVLAMS